MARDPNSREEWQAAVDAAEVDTCLHIASDLGELEAAKRPERDRDECEEIIRRGRELGIVPRADCLQRWIEQQGSGADQ
jgi:hypothetical protein